MAFSGMRGVLLVAALLGTVLAGCGGGQAGKPTPREQHETRLSKAAGVTTLRIVCVRDLWERTSRVGFLSGDPEIKAKVTPAPGGLVTVELTGPQLVDYLRILWKRGPLYSDPDPLSIRVYNGIAPVIDQIQAGGVPAGTVPEVRIDDPVGGANGSSTPTSAVSPSPSPSHTKSK
ncbi:MULTISPECIES: hypothetical protein [Nonomuraea]|uniref:Uncharacterized protein n=1 Tax=Nonomuraea mangrovi TaxID=2316207 RepID=A0ABW4T0W2_9ACTN